MLTFYLELFFCSQLMLSNINEIIESTEKRKFDHDDNTLYNDIRFNKKPRIIADNFSQDIFQLDNDLKAPFLNKIDSSDIIATYKNPLISDTYMHPSKSNLKIDNPPHKNSKNNYLSDRTVDVVTSKGAFEKSNNVSNFQDSLIQKNNADFVSESNINCSVPDIDQTNLDNNFNLTSFSEKKEFTVKNLNDCTSQKIITKKTPPSSYKKTLLLKIKSLTKKDRSFSLPTDTFLQKLCNKSRNGRIFIVKGNSINPLLCEIKRVGVTLKTDPTSSKCYKTEIPPQTTDYLERVMKRIPVSTNSRFYILSRKENSLLPLILRVESNSNFRFDILHVFYMKNINDEFDFYFSEFGVISEFHKIYTVFFEDEIMLSRFRHIKSIQNNILSELRCIDKCIMNFNNYFVNYKNMYLFLNKGIFARFEYNTLDKTLPSPLKILTDLISTIFADPYFEIFLILFPELSYVKKFLECQGYTRLPLSKTYLPFTILRFKFELLKSKI
ncbi:hypothetical protein TUBRATIS_30990 [Tubulinosema ratisbonensis]|uniref:Uncharacterized protein n=1 Tax=Tubulinosema ratisbonensis TaxID=291195 RepID=A0A437AHB9_9MICR|nr:hypothetical protein TUBRATIS_30990 [Tubulinosema ratisbonensis]